MAQQATPSVKEEAATWFVRLQRADISEEDRQAFDRWIDGDPARAVAYARVESAWERAERLQARPPAEIVSDRPWVTRRIAAATIAALVAGGAGLWSLSRPSIYETDVGARRTVKLKDGSLVHLNTGSKVSVTLGDDLRDIRLVHGEALFEVAKDPSRPFVVRAGDASVKAIGTAFNVRIRDELVELTVTEGVVAVADRRSDAKASTQVTAGTGAIVGPGAMTEIQLDRALVQQRVAWRDGVIELNGETLEQAVAEFNRYRKTPLVIGDSRISAIRVGGTFELDESEQFLGALRAGFNVRTVEGDNGTIYLLPAA